MRRLAGVGFRQTDFEIVAQVRAALGATGTPATLLAATATTAMKSPKRSSKMSDMEEEKSGPKPAPPGPRPAAAHAVFKGLMAETVVGRLLLRVFQHVIGFVHFLELGLGILVAGIGIGMEFLGLFRIGRSSAPFHRHPSQHPELRRSRAWPWLCLVFSPTR